VHNAFPKEKDERAMSIAIRKLHVGRPKLTKEDIPQAFYRHYPAYAAGKGCDLRGLTVYKYVKMVG